MKSCVVQNNGITHKFRLKSVMGIFVNDLELEP